MICSIGDNNVYSMCIKSVWVELCYITLVGTCESVWTVELKDATDVLSVLVSASVFSHAIFFWHNETLIITDHITHHRHNGRINDTTTMLPSGLFSSLSIDLFLFFFLLRLEFSN